MKTFRFIIEFVDAPDDLPVNVAKAILGEFIKTTNQPLELKNGEDYSYTIDDIQRATLQ